MLVDSHCHLQMLDQATPIQTYLDKAREAGVEHVLTVAVSLEDSKRTIALAECHPQVSASVGAHPSDRGPEPTVDEIVHLAASSPRVVAIGETGLDYHYNKGDLEWQRDRFREHIRAAREVGKPLIVHTRDAREDTVRLLREERAAEVGGIIHCFTEDYEMAARCLDMGFYISFSGIVTFRNAEALREVARRVPLERMLVETDSPFLAPVPYRGKPNQPAYVRHVAERLAELHAISLEELARITSENFYTLFPQARSA
ncbi:MAG: TatD family hydrolase [Xanthomonadaceae bacterium]|nr:TatD family hydrolase [Xanthomonadaceae bacterium]